jgi:hypothetical protein
VTITAYDDQFTPAPEPTGFSTREMVDMFNEGRAEERKLLAAWFRKHGRPQIADQIEAGEHLKPPA